MSKGAQLIHENIELAMKLAEAEETLNAIRTGEVDSIVVSGIRGEQVYSISSTETPYRTFIEEMNEGAITLTKEGIILYCNKKFAEFVFQPLESVIGAYINNFIVFADQPKLHSLLGKNLSDHTSFISITLESKLHIKLSSHSLPPYLGGDNTILIATDITEMKKNENELIKLHATLKEKHAKIKELRLDLINRKIDSESAADKLRNTNIKLVQEIEALKLRAKNKVAL